MRIRDGGEPLDAGPGNLVPVKPGSMVKPLYGPAAILLVRGCRSTQPLVRGFAVKCRDAKVYDLTEDPEARLPKGAVIVVLRRTIVKSGGREHVLEPGEIHECMEECTAAGEGRLHIVVIEPRSPEHH